MKKIFLLSLLLVYSLYAQNRVYYYSSENNIDSFKKLKVSFDSYLKHFGSYDFQAFNQKEIFESYVKEEGIILLLSSWHYKELLREYKLTPLFVTKKDDAIMDTKVLVGKNREYRGILTTAFTKEYTSKLLHSFSQKKKNLSFLKVPKEIDALMSVAFGMSQYAVVSKSSFELLEKTNAYIVKDMKILLESKPEFRVLIAAKDYSKERVSEIFSKLKEYEEGKRVLELLGVDDITRLSNSDIKLLDKEGSK